MQHQDLMPGDLGSYPGSVSYYLCDPEQVNLISVCSVTYETGTITISIFHMYEVPIS